MGHGRQGGKYDEDVISLTANPDEN